MDPFAVKKETISLLHTYQILQFIVAQVKVSRISILFILNLFMVEFCYGVEFHAPKGSFERQIRENEKIIAAFNLQTKKVNQEVIAFKDLIGGSEFRNADISIAHRMAYNQILKNLLFIDLYNLPPCPLRELLLKHKANLLQREHLFATKLNDSRKNGALPWNLNSEALGTIADIGWESANLLNHTHLLSPNGPKSSTTIGPQTLAGFLNLGASGIGIGLTLYSAINVLSVKKLTARLKYKLRNNEKDLATMQESLQKLKLNKKDQDQNDIIFLSLDINESKKKAAILSAQIQAQKQRTRKMTSQLFFDFSLSSSYFSSSAMVLWGGHSSAMGIFANLLGGVTYGGLLLWLGSRGITSSKKALKQVKFEIESLNSYKDHVQLFCQNRLASHYCKERMTIIDLKLKMLRQYKRKISRWNHKKGLFTTALGGSSILTGVSGSAISVGFEATLATMFTISGYGVIIFLGAAVVSGSIAYSVKHHVPRRVHDQLKRKFIIDKQNEDEAFLPAYHYYSQKKRLKMTMLKYQRKLKSLNKKSLVLASMIKEDPDHPFIQSQFSHLENLAKKIVTLSESMDQLVSDMHRNLIFLKVKGKESKPVIKNLLRSISQLNREERQFFAYQFDFLSPEFQAIKENEIQIRHLQTRVCEEVIGF